MEVDNSLHGSFFGASERAPPHNADTTPLSLVGVAEQRFPGFCRICRFSAGFRIDGLIAYKVHRDGERKRLRGHR